MLDNFTICPARVSLEHSSHPTDLVLVLPRVDLALGFQRARTLLQHQRAVRIVGNGVTLSENWPDWATTEPNLLLTELGAYEPVNSTQEFLPLRADIDQWLDSTFADAIGQFRGSQIFYNNAYIRLFRAIIEVFPALKNLTKVNGAVRYHCAEEGWSGLELLRNLVEESGGTLEGPAPRKTVFWSILVLAAGVLTFIGTAVDELIDYLKEAPSRSRLRKLRSRRRKTTVPRFWIMLVPDYWRLNRHALEGVVKPALSSGERIGVLLAQTLRPGSRLEYNMRARSGSEVWPGLGLLQREIEECSVDQVTSTESVVEFLAIGSQALRKSIRVLLRLACGPSRICLGAFHFDLAGHQLQVAKLVTKDIWISIAAERATRAAIQRHSFAGQNVISVSSTYCDTAVADLVLQSAGATTVEYVHGSAGTWFEDAPSVSNFKCVWTWADVASVAGFGQPTIVAGAPRMVIKNCRPPGYKPRNILIVSNYVHHYRRKTGAKNDGTGTPTWIGSIFPEFAFQEELLTVIRVIRNDFGQRFQFRWRPHPADIDEAVMTTFKKYPSVELSRKQPLEQDVAWADLIITSLSSTVVEFLLAEVPIFLHVLPVRQHTPDVAAFAPERTFFRARDLPSFTQCIAAMDAGEQSYLEPERRARMAFFGPTGEPISLFDLLQTGGLQNLKCGTPAPDTLCPQSRSGGVTLNQQSTS